MRTSFTLILLLISLSAFAQIRVSAHRSFDLKHSHSMTFRFYDAVALEPQNKDKDLFEFRITDSISVTIRAPKVTETISTIPQTELAHTNTDFKGAENVLVTVRTDRYEELIQVCPMPHSIMTFDAFLRKKE